MASYLIRTNIYWPNGKRVIFLATSNAVLRIKGLYSHISKLSKNMVGKLRRHSTISRFGICLLLVGVVIVQTSCYNPGASSQDNPILVHIDGISQATLDAIKGDPGPQGVQGEQGIGVKGDKGDKGDAGTNGSDGSVFLYGTYSNIPLINTIPNGSIYIDTDDSHFWQSQYVTSLFNVKESYTTATGSPINYNYGSQYDAMTFTTTGSYNCSKVSLYAKRTNSPTNIYISLYATTAGYPSGSALATSAYLTLDTSYSWIDATFTPITLSNSTMYAIVIQCTGDSSNYVFISCDSGDPYPTGAYCYTTNSGSTWAHYGNFDASFKVYQDGSSSQQWIQIK